MGTTIFERCGGFLTVRKVVSAFYDKVLESPQLQKHFANTDMRTLIEHQTKFVATIMGGPASYTDHVLRRVHAGLGITHQEFEEVTMLLSETLEDFGLEARDISQVEIEIRRHESCIVVH